MSIPFVYNTWTLAWENAAFFLRRGLLSLAAFARNEKICTAWTTACSCHVRISRHRQQERRTIEAEARRLIAMCCASKSIEGDGVRRKSLPLSLFFSLSLFDIYGWIRLIHLWARTSDCRLTKLGVHDAPRPREYLAILLICWLYIYGQTRVQQTISGLNRALIVRDRVIVSSEQIQARWTLLRISFLLILVFINWRVAFLCLFIFRKRIRYAENSNLSLYFYYWQIFFRFVLFWFVLSFSWISESVVSASRRLVI